MPKTKAVPALPARFTMEFQPTTIEHLGLKLYSSLPPVIGELVSNAWDAEAKNVHITIPTGPINETSTVTVQDDGVGMAPDDLQGKYLSIGRNRREAEGKDISGPGLKRLVTGRKGLGKLSGFGIADDLEIRAVKDGFAVAIELSYPKMKAWPKGTNYEPKVITNKTGPTTDPNGTSIIVKSLRRRRPIIAEFIRHELARRFRFIGTDFRVFINGEPIHASDRRQKSDCRIAWDVSELKAGSIVDQANEWTISGWIGLVCRI